MKEGYLIKCWNSLVEFYNGVEKMKKNETEGIVLEINGEFAWVRCNTSFIFLGEGTNKVEIEVKNEINAVVADKVFLEISEGNMLKAAFIVFTLPFILVFSGIYTGYKMSEILRINSTVAAVVGGILLFAISIIIIGVSKKTRKEPVITRKI